MRAASFAVTAMVMAAIIEACEPHLIAIQPINVDGVGQGRKPENRGHRKAAFFVDEIHRLIQCSSDERLKDFRCVRSTPALTTENLHRDPR